MSMRTFFSPPNVLSPSAKDLLSSSSSVLSRRRRAAGTPATDKRNPPPTSAPRSSRKPLFGLSPNLKWGTTSKASCEELKQQIAELRHRIKILDGNSGRNELLNVIEQKTQESQRKEEQLHALNHKLCGIEKDLSEIEQERQSLMEKAKQLEKEKTSLKDELSMREKEISSLSRRCTTQADKMKETTKLRSERNKLLEEVAELKANLEQRRADDITVEDVKRELEDCRQSRDALAEKLKAVNKNHDEISESLRQCLSSVRRLTDEKREWEEERRRLERRLELDLEQQRLDHVQSTIEMKEDLRSRDVRISQLEQNIQEKVTLIQQLRKQMNDLSKTHSDLIQKLQNEHEQQLTDAKTQNNERVSGVREEFEETLGQVESKLQEKDRMIGTLQEEVSNYMQEIMATSSALEKQKEESGLIESLTSDVEALEHERYTLSESLHERQTEIAELSAEILKLEMEKELLEQDSQRLEAVRAKLSASEEEKASIRSRFEKELDNARNAISALEEELRETVEANEKGASKMQVEQSEVVASLQSKIEALEYDSQNQTLQHRDVLSAKERTIAVLKAKLQDLTDDSLESAKRHQADMSALRNEVQKAKTEVALKDDEIRDLRMIELQEREDTIEDLRKEVRRLTKLIEANNANSSSIKADLESQIEQLKSRSGEQESRAAERAREQQAVIDGMSESISDLKREKGYQEILLCDQERKLEDHKSEAASLSEKLRDVVASEQELQSECRKLRLLEQDTKNEKEKLELALEREISRNDSSRQNERELQSRFENLQKELANAEAKLVSQEEQMVSLEAALNDRTKLLGDMVAHNKELQLKLEQKGSRHIDLEEEVRQLQLQLSDQGEELDRLNSEWQKKEDKYLEDLHTEQHQREIAESDLEAARSKLQSLKRDNKDATELAKENEELKNKIRRQEAYLKRKLQKEKALRVRSNAIPPSKTPAHSRSSPRKTGSAIASKATLSTAEDTSLEWELDSLLAD